MSGKHWVAGSSHVLVWPLPLSNIDLFQVKNIGRVFVAGRVRKIFLASLVFFLFLHRGSLPFLGAPGVLLDPDVD